MAKGMTPDPPVVLTDRACTKCQGTGTNLGHPALIECDRCGGTGEKP